MILMPQSYDPFFMGEDKLQDIFKAVAEEILPETLALNAASVAMGDAAEDIEGQQKRIARFVGNSSVLISLNLSGRLGGYQKMEAGLEDAVIRQALVDEGQFGSDHYGEFIKSGENLSLDTQFQNAMAARDGAIHKSFCNQLANNLPQPA